MKRFFTGVLFALTILSILAALAWCGYCIWDYRQLLQTPGISGIDFLMNGVVYGIGLAGFCVIGAICALVHCRLTVSKKLQTFDCVTAFVMLLGILVAFILMFI